MLAFCPPTDWLGVRRAAMLWLFITSGMRRSELQALRIEDVHFEGRRVWIEHGKGNKSRWAPLHPQAERAIRRWLSFRGDDLEWLWVSRYRQRLGVNAVSDDMERLRSLAGLKGKMPDACHMARRTFAVESVKSGIPRWHAARAAGWSTPSMLAYYTEGMVDDEAALQSYEDNFKLFGR